MIKQFAVLLFFVLAPGLVPCVASPIVTAECSHELESSLDTDSAFAVCSLGYVQWGVNYEGDGKFFLFHDFYAEASPLKVLASAGSYFEEGGMEDIYGWWSGWARAHSAGELKIIGGVGPALADFLVSVYGEFACVSFDPLGAPAGSCTAGGFFSTVSGVPFRFNEAFAYTLEAFADLPGDETYSTSVATILGVRVTDAAGRVISGAQLVPGDYAVPGGEVPEPAGAGTMTCGLLALAARAWRRRRIRA